MNPEVASQLVEALKPIRSRVRLRQRDGHAYGWDWPLFAPVPGYLETGASGPLALSEVESIDVQKEEVKERGRLIPPAIIDHENEIVAVLSKLRLRFEATGAHVRITNEKEA